MGLQDSRVRRGGFTRSEAAGRVESLLRVEGLVERVLRGGLVEREGDEVRVHLVVEQVERGEEGIRQVVEGESRSRLE